MRIRADRDDVDGCLSIRRRERALVDAERDELDARRLAVRLQPPPKLVRLELAVGEHGRARCERARVQAPHVLRAQLRETLGEADRDVDQRRPHPSCPVQEHQRDADRVDRGEDDIGTIRTPKRGEHRGEVAAVAARPLEGRLQTGAGRARPAGRLSRALEVVRRRPAPLGELVEAEEEIALGRSRRGRERRAPGRRVTVGMEDGGHGRGR